MRRVVVALATLTLSLAFPLHAQSLRSRVSDLFRFGASARTSER